MRCARDRRLFVYYLYENCAVADEWYESFEDALESGLTADSERHLTWNPVGSMTRPEPDNLVHATWYREPHRHRQARQSRAGRDWLGPLAPELH